MKTAFLSILLAFAVGLTGCTGSAPTNKISATPEARQDEKMPAEAISYFARIHRSGKPTTFKLEMYLMPELIGFSGRGYLGKGALKGWIDGDSLLVYFPSSQEYLSEKVEEVLIAPACDIELKEFNILELLTSLPDTLDELRQFQTELRAAKEKEREYRLTLDECDWQVDLTYRKTDRGWRVWYLEFTDGANNRLRLRKDQYKGNAKVPRKRFSPIIPSEAVRITP